MNCWEELCLIILGVVDLPKRPDITPEILNELYLVQRKSKEDICKELDITVGSLNYLLSKYNLTKTNGMPYKTGITKEMLYNAVYIEKLTNKQIMEKLNVSEQTIRKLIRNFEIPMRWDNSIYVDNVISLYTKEKLSLSQISKKMNIPKSRARKILLDNNIVLRGKGECQMSQHTVEFKIKWTQPKDSLRKRCRNYFSNNLVPKYKKTSCELCGSVENLCVHHNTPFSVIVQQIISENKHFGYFY